MKKRKAKPEKGWMLKLWPENILIGHIAWSRDDIRAMKKERFDCRIAHVLIKEL